MYVTSLYTQGLRILVHFDSITLSTGCIRLQGNNLFDFHPFVDSRLMDKVIIVQNVVILTVGVPLLHEVSIGGVLGTFAKQSSSTYNYVTVCTHFPFDFDSVTERQLD